MTSIDSLTLEVPDPVAAGAFYGAACGLADRVTVRRLGRANDRSSASATAVSRDDTQPDHAASALSRPAIAAMT